MCPTLYWGFHLSHRNSLTCPNLAAKQKCLTLASTCCKSLNPLGWVGTDTLHPWGLAGLICGPAIRRWSSEGWICFGILRSRNSRNAHHDCCALRFSPSAARNGARRETRPQAVAQVRHLSTATRQVLRWAPSGCAPPAPSDVQFSNGIMYVCATLYACFSATSATHFTIFFLKFFFFILTL